MKTLEELKKLMEQIEQDTEKCFDKGVYSRGRSARKALSQLAKLCKDARAEVLEQMHKIKGDD